MVGKYKFKNLVFEGGGVKGLAYAGALEGLEKKGILQEVQRVAGTSAGAITAALVALGFSPGEVMGILKETDFNDFMDEERFKFKSAWKLFKTYGWFKGNAFEGWFEKVISKKVDPKITFGQLFEMTGKADKRELYVVGTNLDEKHSVIFSHHEHADLSIAKAVRISMSIPLFFRSVKFDGKIFVDGGLYYNYPINLFDNRQFLFNKAMFAPTNYDSRKGAIFNKETLGLRVDSVSEISANLGKIEDSKESIHNLRDFLMAFFAGLSEVANRRHLHKNDWHRTVYIHSGGVKATDFDLSEDKKKLLIENGRKGVSTYFSWFDGRRGERPLNK